MAVVAQELQSVEDLRSAFDPSGFGPAGAKHTGTEIIILKTEVPFGECLVAELFHQGSQQRPQPAANKVFNREQGPRLVGTEQDSNAGPIDGICGSHLLGLERPETGQAEQCIGAAE